MKNKSKPTNEIIEMLIITRLESNQRTFQENLKLFKINKPFHEICYKAATDFEWYVFRNCEEVYNYALDLPKERQQIVFDWIHSALWHKYNTLKPLFAEDYVDRYKHKEILWMIYPDVMEWQQELYQEENEKPKYKPVDGN